MKALELLAPARNAEIGIAAIDCGADAVYIAGPAFGARQAAGNPVEDIALLCSKAHRYGARVFVTLNTILYDSELSEAAALLKAVAAAGADAVIVQDMAVLPLAGKACPDLPLHASTQCAVRDSEKARFLESLGFSRIVLERQLTLNEIASISKSVDAEIECFVHGALCVCYSGQCYLSEMLSGRSAGRGCCVQACRSLYDLVDGGGRVIARNRPLLSLKDLNLIDRLEDLAAAGVTSFKIEGRLKGLSYVMNVTRAYSAALDELVERHPDLYRRASFGRVEGGFTPDLSKTFNRGYTSLFIDGHPSGSVLSVSGKHLGEPVGTVASVRKGRGAWTLSLTSMPDGTRLSNGDGFAFLSSDGEVTGFRGDVCKGAEVTTAPVPLLKEGIRIYRNLDAGFEKTVSARKPVRFIHVDVSAAVEEGTLTLDAVSEDGRRATVKAVLSGETALDRLRMAAMVRTQLSKRTGHYSFSLKDLSFSDIPLMSGAFLNDLRRQLASILDSAGCRPIPLGRGKVNPALAAPGSLSYKENVSNHLSRELYEGRGTRDVEPAYELTHSEGAELMRTRHCIKLSLGLCPKRDGAAPTGDLFLVNNGRRLSLGFDCSRCEMTVSAQLKH